MAHIFCDKTQPRVRKSYSAVMHNEDIIEFVKQYPEHEGITLREFNAIVNKFNQNVANEVINKREGVMLPERLGYLIIASFSRPRNRKIVNWGESEKQGRLVYHMNWDTDNRIGKIVYRRERVTLGALLNIWGFTATRSFSKQMSEAFKRNYHKYIFVRKNLFVEIATS